MPLLFIFLFISLGCREFSEEFKKGMEEGMRDDPVVKKAPGPMIYTASDDSCEVEAPEGWAVNSPQDPTSVIHLYNRAEDSVVWIMRDPKSDLRDGIKIDAYAEMAKKDFMDSVEEDESKVEATFPGRAGSYEARQFEASALSGDLKLKYSYTVVETQENFYRLMFWAAPSRFEKGKESAAGIFASFKELAKDKGGPDGKPEIKKPPPPKAEKPGEGTGPTKIN